MVGICDPYDVSFKEGILFLAYLFHDKEQKHGTIDIVRSALSAILLTKDGRIFCKTQIPADYLKEDLT